MGDLNMANDEKWCFAWYSAPKGAPGANRAALVKGAKWTPGDVITVSYLDGDPGVQAKVRAVATQWTAARLARLTLSFRTDTTDTDIRISFQFAGSWSVIGTTCRNVPAGQPTMNYGWLTPASDDVEVRRVVLHEFGHALGLIHEHQSPAGGIQWNRRQVIADLSGPPNNWDAATIEHNMFEPVAAAETNFTALDAQSIMMYPIPAGWTTDGFSVGLNSDLSATDKQFIHGQYP
jgi:serralysin